MYDSQTSQYLERLATDFSFFLEELWREIGMPSIPKHHKEMAHFLQYGKRRRGVLAWRGAAKTWITIAYCCWRLFTNPKTERITYISKSERHAKESLYLARKWIGHARFLQHLVPVTSNGNRDSALAFDVNGAEADRTPSFAAYGITGQVTGSRSTCVVADDIETPENTLTLDMRQRLLSQSAEFENILIPGGDIIYLGTPHHEETLYQSIIDGGYEVLAWPVSHPGAVEMSCPLGPMFASMTEGELVWPDRFDQEELTAREAKMGRSKYAMQYLLKWKLGDELSTPLRLSDFICFAAMKDKAPVTIAWGTTNSHGQSTRIETISSLGFGSDGFLAPIMFDKDWMPYTGVRCWVDPSGRGEDETAYAVVAHLNGYLWILDVGGLPGGFSASTLECIGVMCRNNRVTTCYVEDNFGQGMFAELLTPVIRRLSSEAEADNNSVPWNCLIETVRVSGQKEVRIIEALEPLLNQHRLVIHPSVAGDAILQKQITRIAKTAKCLQFDDRVDALAMACKMWKTDMSFDPAESAKKSREKFILSEIKRLSGQDQKSRRWFSHG